MHGYREEASIASAKAVVRIGWPVIPMELGRGGVIWRWRRIWLQVWGTIFVVNSRMSLGGCDVICVMLLLYTLVWSGQFFISLSPSPILCKNIVLLTSPWQV